MSGAVDALLRGLNGGTLTGGDQAGIAVYFKRLEDGAASSLAISTPGATGGAKIRRLVVDGDLAVPAGNITVGPVAPTKGNVIIDGAGIRLRNYTTNKINLTTGGDVMIGSDLSQPGFTYLSIFSIQQNYNSENFLAGDMLIGDNSASKANIKWDKANGQLKFRGGTTTQAYVDTTGDIMAGGGDVRLDVSGVSIGGTGQRFSFYDTNAFVNLAGYMSQQPTGANSILQATALGYGATFTDALIRLLAEDSKGAATIGVSLDIQAIKTATHGYGAFYAGVGTFDGLTLGANAAPNTMLDVRGSATATGGLNVGSATGAATGSIKASLDGTFAGGLNVGSATGAVAGEILTSLTGTWTPTFNGTTIAGVFTYTAQVGHYVKIGGYVFIVGQVAISAIGTPPTGSMRIGGLPFTSAATYIGGVSFAHISNFKYTAAALQVTGVINTTATNILLRESFTNAATVDVPAANFTNATCEFRFIGMYKY